MTALQEEMWDTLCELSGEEVLRLLTDWHGLQLLDEGFREHLADEGVMDSICSDDEIEDDDEQIDEDADNCDNGTYDCDSCIRNGECQYRGNDGKPSFSRIYYLLYKNTDSGREYVSENGAALEFTGVLDVVKYFSARGQSFTSVLQSGYYLEEVRK